MSERKPVLLVGPRPTPDLVSGMRMGFELLISGFQERELPYRVVDRSTGMSDKKVGTITLESVFATLHLLVLYWKGLFVANSVYITIATSPMGFLRDAVMIWSARVFRKSVVLHLKGGGFLSFYESSHPLLKYYIRKTCAQTHRIIVLGELLRDQFRFVPNVSTKLRVVPNGLPRGLDSEQTSAKTLQKPGVIRLLYLSNLIPSKGYLDLLDACALLRNGGIPILCDYCGALVRTISEHGVEISESYFHSRVEELKLVDVVKYHGTVHGARKEQFLKDAHLLILPTSYPWEGQPISIIEALAYATPVISTRYRGIPEQVIHEYNGLLIEPNNPVEIARSVEQLWNDPDRYATYSRNALYHFRAHFTRQAHLNRIIPILLENG